MAISLCQTLIRTTAIPSYVFSAAKPKIVRCFSIQPKGNSHAELMTSEVEAKAVERIEDYIYNIIIHRSRPEWLPFVPGASYWAPPRQSSYGVSEIVHKLANALTEEEYLSLLTLQGFPSSAFYLQNDESSRLDVVIADEASYEASHGDDED
ncbi:hypothetical protein OROMI_004576 [Orobanche minor]